MWRKYIADLVNSELKSSLSIHHINWWLMKYEDEFYDAISKSECGKWSKWVKNNSIHVFPCACPTREQDCIFIELYFELLKVSKLEANELFFESIMDEYNSIQNEEFALRLWLEKYKAAFADLKFVEIIIVKLTTEPYTKIAVELNEDDFRNIILFQKTYKKGQFSKLI